MLKPKQTITLPDGRKAKVLKVSTCAAVVQPLGRDIRTVNGHEIKARYKTIRISAEAEVETVQRRTR